MDHVAAARGTSCILLVRFFVFNVFLIFIFEGGLRRVHILYRLDPNYTSRISICHPNVGLIFRKKE